MTLFFDFILVGGIIITLMILFLLIKSKRRALPQNLLILFFAFLLAYMVHGYADRHDLPILYVITFLFNDCIEIFLGPLIFIYIKSLFEDNTTLIKKNWFHFAPTLFYLAIISIPILVSVIIDRYLFDYLRILNENSLIAMTILMVYLIVYILLSLRLFYKYKKAMMLNFSTMSSNDFNWVRQMLIGALIVSCTDLILSLYELSTEELTWETDYVTLVIVIIFTCYLGYYGINQTKVLLPDFLIREESAKNIRKGKSNQLSGFNDDEIKLLQSRLEEILLNEKPYLDEGLTLGMLAQMLPTTDKKLSTLLNQYMNTTFYDLINKYRVEAVKKKLDSGENDNLTLLGIAYESGFKSKTSFNRIFKKETGLSPSEYKKKL